MADISMTYQVATNQNVLAADHNTTVEAVTNVNNEAEALAMVRGMA